MAVPHAQRRATGTLGALAQLHTKRPRLQQRTPAARGRTMKGGLWAEHMGPGYKGSARDNR